MKQLALALLWFLITSAAQGAGFDCARAASKVEKLICGDAELSRLDEEMSSVYLAAMKDTDHAGTTRQTQKQPRRMR